MILDLRQSFFKDKLEFEFEFGEKSTCFFKLKHINFFKFEKLKSIISDKSFEDNYDYFYEYICKIFDIIEVREDGKKVEGDLMPSDFQILVTFFVMKISASLEDLKKK